MSNELIALAERCEAATGPDRALDAAVAVGSKQVPYDFEPAFLEGDWRGKYDNRSWSSPAYTATVDDAMSLVPEGWLVDRLGENWRDGVWTAQIAERASPNLIAAFDAGRMIGRESEEGAAATPALALTAAALRARAAQQERKA